MWTQFVKVVSYITLVGGIIASLIMAGVISSGTDNPLIAIGVFVTGTLFTAMSVSMTMVMVEISERVESCEYYLRNNSISLSASETGSSAR